MLPIWIPGQGFGGGRGEKGEQGDPGADGDPGPAGADGQDGSDGSDGATGAQGPTGETGATGPAGATGAAGSNGSNGTNGADALQCGLRLTNVTALPILTSNQMAKTSIFHTPFKSGLISLWSAASSAWVRQSVSEASLSTSGFTASRMHDIYSYMNGATYTLEALAWSNNTTAPTRGTQNGILVKNGEPEKLYIGSAYVDSNKYLNFSIGGIGAGGSEIIVPIWNEYNRIENKFFSGDSATSWTHGNDASWSAASNTVKATFAVGRLIEPFEASVKNRPTEPASTSGAIAIGLDSTSSPAANQEIGYNNPSSTFAEIRSQWEGYPSLPGLHYVQALDFSTGGTSTFYGDNNVAFFQSGMHFKGWF